MGKFLDLTGQTFNRWKVIKRVKNNKYNQIMWLCQCECKGENSIKIVNGGDLRTGKSKSCGCLQKEIVSINNKKYNTYDLSGEYGIGYTTKGEYFCFDLEDYDLIKDYCWYMDKDGYIISNLNKNIIQMHRLVTNCPEDKEVDHQFHDNFDNRKSNLRITTRSQNGMNTVLAINNTSGIIGVGWHKRDNKWQARIGVNNKRIHLGFFKTKDDAIIARLQAEKEYFGEYAPQQHLYKQYSIN